MVTFKKSSRVTTDTNNNPIAKFAAQLAKTFVREVRRLLSINRNNHTMRSWIYDPSKSSGDYLNLARKRARHDKMMSGQVRWMLFWDDFDFGTHRSHVQRLLDPDNWSRRVIDAGRKPRVFIEAYLNRSGNIEVRSIGGWEYGIYFDNDFTKQFLDQATLDHQGDYRSLGELMWIRGFSNLVCEARMGKSPVAKTVLFGFKARLDELIVEISKKVNVVGYMSMNFLWERNRISRVEFLPSISLDEIRELKAVMFD